MGNLLNEKQAALIACVSLSKLRSDRCQMAGIAYIKIGRSVRYKIEDIQEFIENNRIDPQRKFKTKTKISHSEEI